MNKQIGRNDSCPCGSGKKFKKCCMLAAATNDSFTPGIAGQQTMHPAKEVSALIRQALDNQQFDNIDDVNAFLESFSQKRNQAAMDDFHGLSPAQMHSVLYQPFTSPEVVQFKNALLPCEQTPAMRLYKLIFDAATDDGLKQTAKGNLGQKFCREAALSFWGEAQYQDETRFGGINKEEDFLDLHVLRLVAELAGLLRKNKGKFLLTQKAKKLNNTQTYHLLLQTYCEKFLWAYRDRFEDLEFIQTSAFFTLYLLERYGNEWRETEFYANHFINAFPMLLDEVDCRWRTAEEEVFSCYELRAIRHFGLYFGLVEVKWSKTERYLKNIEAVRATDLLRQWVGFAC
ncbi:MAG: SEC-C domain-containing protein [Hahellaceae bacterium]|nr:SEC-C domain-containing protein [Hahellaceae bacterium]MCP5212249.1 SEC-C domain-containing protein [Hahellaceae bacterium]